jgi:hypothetical protein
MILGKIIQRSRLEIIIVFLITIIGLLYYTIRLSETQLFIYDTARDTLMALRLWQEKKLALIGAPASFSQHSVQEFYFGSVYLYVAILGLILSNFNPVGAVYPNVFLFTLSIPIFYLFVSRLTKNSYQKLFSTAIYSFSPITLTHARFFWNPNLLIPLSTFFWYLIFAEPNTSKISKKLFLSGIIGGLMINLHYSSLIPIIVYLLYLIFSKKYQPSLNFILGIIVGSLPLILFEFRNNFYLSNALIFNFGHGNTIFIRDYRIVLDSISKIFLAIFGLRHGEISFTTFNLNNVIKYFFAFLIILISIKKYFYRKNKISTPIYLCLLCTIIFSIFVLTYDLQLHYLFSVYPLLIYLIGDALSETRWQYLSLFVFLPIFFVDYHIITAKVNVKDNYLSLDKIELISQAIIEDKPLGAYNVIDYLYNDIPATSLRYYLLRDAPIKPESEINYDKITTLYVLSPSLEKIQQTDRWEFSASGPKKLIKTFDFGDAKLFKFNK